MKIAVDNGYFFSVGSKIPIGEGIRFVERMQQEIAFFIKTGKRRSADVKYSHSGIISDSDGNTVEARWTVAGYNLNDYIGEQMIIGHWTKMDKNALEMGWESIGPEIEETYPTMRLLLFLIGLAGYVSGGIKTVCSELWKRFMLGSGCGYLFKLIGAPVRWQGCEPQDMADLLHANPKQELVIDFEGIWEG